MESLVEANTTDGYTLSLRGYRNAEAQDAREKKTKLSLLLRAEGLSREELFELHMCLGAAMDALSHKLSEPTYKQLVQTAAKQPDPPLPALESAALKVEASK